MAGINPDISTSSFKPLSLDEIMMVPLAKQQQEDNTQLALDEFSALESQALGPDKEYVSGQLGAFKKEAGSLSDQLMNQGVDRNLINKVKGLRNKKTNELSLEGRTGQAAAAYNQYKANEKNIMNRKDLTSDQKRLGLQEALFNYKGVSEGGQYQDYVGASHIDIMDKGREIASKMTPQEIAKATGVTIDENGLYRDNGYVYKTLPAHLIEKVVKQALESDQDLMAYAKEMERLGISTVEQEFSKAAQSAGNIYQRKDINEISKLLPGNMQTSLDPNRGMIDTSQPWDTADIPYQEGLWNETISLVDKNSENAFTPDGMFKEPEVKKDLGKRNDLTTTLWGNSTLSKERTTSDSNPFSELKKSIETLRANNPILNSLKPAKLNPDGSVKEPPKPWSDKEIYDIYKNGEMKASKSMSKVIKPVNPNNTFVKIGEDLIGSGDRNGSFVTKNMKMSGFPSGGKDVIASQLDLDPSEFNEIVRKTGRVIGFSPGHIDMPGAYTVQIELEDGSTPVVYMQNDGKARRDLDPISRMNSLVRSGKNFDSKQIRGSKGDIINEMFVSELNPHSKSYEAATIRSETKYTKDELDQLNFKRVPGSGPVMVAVNDDGSLIIPEVYKTMYDDEIQRGINSITKHYDEAPNQKQSLSKAQKN